MTANIEIKEGDDHAALREAIAAVTRCVLVALASDRPDRFSRAEQYSKVANSLQRIGAKRVGDLPPRRGGALDFIGAPGFDMDENQNQPVMPGAIYGGGNFNDGADVNRQLLMQTAPILKDFMDGQRGAARARELRDHASTRAELLEQQLSTTKIDERIAALMEEINADAVKPMPEPEKAHPWPTPAEEARMKEPDPQ